MIDQNTNPNTETPGISALAPEQPFPGVGQQEPFNPSEFDIFPPDAAELFPNAFSTTPEEAVQAFFTLLRVGARAINPNTAGDFELQALRHAIELATKRLAQV